jgi:hypothetical protein
VQSSSRRCARRISNGRFWGSPTRVQLERSFFLNDADRELVEQRRRDPNRLGFGVQLGTVRRLKRPPETSATSGRRSSAAS